MRTHGWAGNRPASDEEAAARILDATRSHIDAHGADVNIADIARSLGVTRQTIYRYFPGTQALLVAVTVEAAGTFLDRLVAHLRGRTDPADAVVEAMAYCIEHVPTEPYIGALLAAGNVSAFAEGVTSSMALAFGRTMVEQFDVDWDAAGLDDNDLDGLVEWMLRVLQSFIVDPGGPPRTGQKLRAYLAEWVGPAVTARASA
jgi:AcrR family transcriptional regulator